MDKIIIIKKNKMGGCAHKEDDRSKSVALDFKVKYVKFEVIEDRYAEFIFKVSKPIGLSFEFKDRYSKIGEFRNNVKK